MAVLSFFPGGDGNYNITELFERKCTLINLSLVSTIISFTFAKNYSLTHVNMPDVTTIETEAFHMCSNISYIQTPKLTYIHSYAFDMANNLSGNLITIEVGQNFSTASYAFANCSTRIIALGTRGSSGAHTVGSYCFYSCAALMHILFGGTVGYWTFSSSGLFTGAFSNATTTTPAAIEIVSCSLISNQAFNCSKPYTLILHGNYNTIPTLGNSSTTLGSMVQEILVPSAYVDAFKAATNWSKYKTIIKATES